MQIRFFLLAKLGSPAAIEAVQKSTHLDIYKLNLSEKVISSIRIRLHPEIYNDEKIEQFINEALSLDISIPSNLERAILLATKAFWGREDLLAEYEQALSEIKKETEEASICRLAKQLIAICQLRDIEIANQILLWQETLYKTNPKNLVSCLFWAAICKELELAQGTQKFVRYLRYLRGD